jgi:ABC-type nickel/cobalt efflux system permease component RcnA
VVSISTRGGTLGEHARRGAVWGLGHALTLLLLAGGCILLGVAIPERTGRALEGAVGVMLLVLGVSVFVRMRAQRIHVHGHVHADGTAHVHPHVHPHAHARDGRDHDHGHHALGRPALRTLLVGAVHGLAGSSALVLLVGSAAQSPALGIAYVLLFGLGAVVGMTALAGTLALPLGTRAAAAGAFSIALGLHVVWSSVLPGAA